MTIENLVLSSVSFINSQVKLDLDIFATVRQAPSTATESPSFSFHAFGSATSMSKPYFLSCLLLILETVLIIPVNMLFFKIFAGGYFILFHLLNQVSRAVEFLIIPNFLYQYN